MRTIEKVVDIAATPHRVWEILTDFPRYPTWATYIQELRGRAEVGSKLRLVEGHPGAKPYVVMVPVVEATPNTRLAWAATIPGAAWLPDLIYTGVHEFVLEARPDGGTRLTHRESFSGLLARLVKEGLPGGDEGFDAFNQALKRRAEA